MKRIISLILCFSFLFALTACQKDETTEKTEKSKLDILPHITATGALTNVTITEKGGDEGDADDHVIKLTDDMKYSSVMANDKRVEEITAKVDDQWYNFIKNGSDETHWYRVALGEDYDPSPTTLADSLEFFWSEDIFEELANNVDSFYEKDGTYVLDSLILHNELLKIPETVVEEYNLYTGFDGTEIEVKNIIITVDTNYITTMKFSYESPLSKEEVNISYAFTNPGSTTITLPAEDITVIA